MAAIRSTCPLVGMRGSVWTGTGSQQFHKLRQTHHHSSPFTSWQPVSPVECSRLGTQRHHTRLDFHSLCTAAYKQCGWAHCWSWPTSSFPLEKGAPCVSMITYLCVDPALASHACVHFPKLSCPSPSETASGPGCSICDITVVTMAIDLL